MDAPSTEEISRRKRLGRGIPIAVALAIVGGIIGGALYSWIPRSRPAPSDFVRPEMVAGRPMTEHFVAQGTVSVLESSTLYAPADGSVTFHVARGDTVLKDAILATVDSPSLQTQFKREQATLEKLTEELGKAQLEMRQQFFQNQVNIEIATSHFHAAQRELKRLQDAWDLRAIPQRDLERGKDDWESAELIHKDAIANAKAQRDILAYELKGKQLDIDRQRLLVGEMARRIESLTLRSAVAGVISSLSVRQRATILQNAELLTVVDLSTAQIEFGMPEAYSATVVAGMTTDISYKGSNYQGVVASLSSTTAHGLIRGRVRFTDLAPPELKQNERVELRFLLEERRSALSQRNSIGTR
jgi:HlyD family secretion protein